jgi:predicted nucleic acid-binding Zn ribbon protein
MPTNNYTCSDCEAYFAVTHKQDEEFFTVQMCPFCGAQVEMDEDYEELEEDDE